MTQRVEQLTEQGLESQTAEGLNSSSGGNVTFLTSKAWKQVYIFPQAYIV